VKITARTQGFSELNALFKQLPPKIADQVLQAGVNAGARELAKAAKKAAPDYKGKLSGGPKGTAATHAKYGELKRAIKAKGLRKKFENKRAAVVSRGGAFWGDFLNRGTRYIPATRWYDDVLNQATASALETMKRYMVAKITQVSLKAIQAAGANKR